MSHEPADIDVIFDDRREGRPVMVRVIPLKYVIWIGSTLFVLWNVIGFPLLDYYISRRLNDHDTSMDSHPKVVKAMVEVLGTGDSNVSRKLEEMNTRLSRIEGALGVKVK